MPALLVNGIFFPKFSASIGMCVIIGREFYRYGYMTNDGPNSKIREIGAIPLNVAEISLYLGLALIISRYFFGGFFSRRKLI